MMSEIVHSLGPVEFVPDVLEGLPVALQVTALTIGLGMPLGLLLALAGLGPSRLTRWPAFVVVEIGRGLPLLVLLYVFYQGMPQIGLNTTAFLSATVAFVWSCAAYSSEIFRGGLGAVPQGQREAAAADGFSPRDATLLIVLPQAARISVPPLLNLSIQMFQFTSLAYGIALSEIMQQAYMAGAATYRYLDAFVAAAIIYAAVSIPSSFLVGRLDKRFRRHLDAATS
jgi:polar amino acid transport system permease protein